MRIDPDPGGSELDVLNEYLDYQRETFLLKTDGLSREQLAQRLPPSRLTLAGMLYHLALVEEGWTEKNFPGASLPRTLGRRRLGSRSQLGVPYRRKP